MDASLQRLGTDYIDLYQIHRFDPATPLEETMEALHDVVKAGKVRYLGASSMWAWQFAKAQQVAKEHGWTRFVSMQNHYNLVYREEEREMIPLCQDAGVALLPWSPSGAGLSGQLGRKAARSSLRAQADDTTRKFYGREADLRVRESLRGLAAGEGRAARNAGVRMAVAQGRHGADRWGNAGRTSSTRRRPLLDVTLTEAEVAGWKRPTSPDRCSATPEPLGWPGKVFAFSWVCLHNQFRSAPEEP